MFEQDLLKSHSEGEDKVEMCEKLAENTLFETSQDGRQTIQRQVEKLRSDWSEFTDQMEETRTRLEALLHRWQTYEEMYERLSAWIRDKEKITKDYILMATLDEKKDQLKKYQVIIINYQSSNLLLTSINITSTSSYAVRKLSVFSEKKLKLNKLLLPELNPRKQARK